MSFSEPFIRRPIATSLLAAGILISGILAYFSLPVAPLPKVEYPTINVNAALPGVDPETAASALAAPLEKRFGVIAGVSEITSTSSLGGASISIQFDLDRDINGAARDVQAAINTPRPAICRLICRTRRPTAKSNPSAAPVMVLAMTSDTMPLTDIFNVADQLVGQRLSQVSGVSQVGINGGAKSAVRVQVNPAAIAALNLSMDESARHHPAGQCGRTERHDRHKPRILLHLEQRPAFPGGNSIATSSSRSANGARCFSPPSPT